MRKFILIIIRIANTENNANSENMVRSTRIRGAVITQKRVCTNAHAIFFPFLLFIACDFELCVCVCVWLMPIVNAFYLCLHTGVRVCADDEAESRIFRNDVGPAKLICIWWTRSGRIEYVSVRLLRDYRWRHTHFKWHEKFSGWMFSIRQLARY